MSRLPSSWSVVPLDALAEAIVGGGTPDKSDASNFQGPVPFMTVKDMKSRFITSTVDSISERAVVSSATAVIPADTLVVATRMSLGKIVRPMTNVAINQDLKAIFLRAGVDKTYIEYYWRSSAQHIQSLGTGTTVKGIRLEHIRGLEVPVAPESEQRRIADKLDTVLARVDAVNDRLARVAPLLKRFRQSVLAAATSGSLTLDWRQSRVPQPRSARQELNEILKVQSGLLRVRGEAARVNPDELFSLPDSWAWVLNHELAEDDSNAICAGPFGTIFKAKDFRDEGVPIIFLRHIGEGRYLTHKPGFMATEVWRDFHQPYSVYGGELLVTKLGDPPGTACIYPEGIGTAMVTPDVMKMCVNASAAEPRYLMHFFNSPNSKRIVEALCFGVTRLRIDLSMFKTFPMPLPTREEQSEIVRRVELLFAYADRLEARLQAAQTTADRLTPALLAKAFRGELVPQDPNDEPASELLKRLAAHRAQGPSSTSAGRVRGRKPIARADHE